MYYLVIVESPAKKDKISKFLNTIKGHRFRVEASFGHIRDFKNGLKSIDTKNNFKPTYKISPSKKKVVSFLKSIVPLVDKVIIATDRDREGEAIGYHLVKVLGLSIDQTKRICFNEITKKAIVDAFNNATLIDMDLVYSQMARSIIDLLIGYEISPLLWHIQNRLSAGRCQSPALRLVCERESEIEQFKPTSSFVMSAIFKAITKQSSQTKQICLESKYETLKKINKSRDDIKALMQKIFPLSFTMILQSNKIHKISPPAPYITSTIQQDASNILRMSPKVTMNVLQKLYEKGLITYMRTDSVNISQDCQKQCKDYIEKHYPNMSFVKRQFSKKVVNAQEAHESIRPVMINKKEIKTDNKQQERLYMMIWKRTLACFMSSYVKEVFTYKFTCSKHIFQTQLFKHRCFGFKILYNIDKTKDDTELVETLVIPQQTHIKSICVEETLTKPKSRFSEAQLVQQLEKLGIGRPSTFSSIISTLETRSYVTKQRSSVSKSQSLKIFRLDQKEFTEKTVTKKESSQKGKLFPTEIGKTVNQFLIQHFSQIDSYEYTKSINELLDKIADRKQKWYKVIEKVYKAFKPICYTLKSSNKQQSSYLKKQTLYSTIHIQKQDYNIYKDIYGFKVVRDNDNKSIRIKEEKDITESNIEDLFKYPIILGNFNKQQVIIKKGPYGLYATIDGQNVSVPNNKVQLNDVIELYKNKKKNIIKEWKTIKILNGPYGPYIKKGKQNTKIPSTYDEKTIKSLTQKQCEEIIKQSKTIKKQYKKKWNQKQK